MTLRHDITLRCYVTTLCHHLLHEQFIIFTNISFAFLVQEYSGDDDELPSNSKGNSDKKLKHLKRKSSQRHALQAHKGDGKKKPKKKKGDDSDAGNNICTYTNKSLSNHPLC